MNFKQLRLAHFLINQLGLNEQKGNIVAGFSKGRTTHFKELDKTEALECIKWLSDKQSQPGNKMRNKIFFYCHQMGWTKINASGKVVADGARFDLWALKYSYLRKKLNQYTYEELPKLVSQFEGVYKSFLKSI